MLPAHLTQFIAHNISSVAQLEVLLLLRAQSDKRWSADEVSRSLYTTEQMSAAQLADLYQRGLLERAEESQMCYWYQPKTAELEQMVAELADFYHDRRVTVITAIYSDPVDKIRTFADAFRLRKDK